MIKPVLDRLKINVGRIRTFGYFLQNIIDLYIMHVSHEVCDVGELT
jgi:hypothetical protein